MSPTAPNPAPSAGPRPPWRQRWAAMARGVAGATPRLAARLPALGQRLAAGAAQFGRGLAARGRSAAARLKALALAHRVLATMLGAGLVAMLGTGSYVAYFIGSQPRHDHAALVRLATVAFEEGRSDDAYQWAGQARRAAGLTDSERRTTLFLLGAVSMQRAEIALGAMQRRERVLAAEYLKEAAFRGFSEERRGEGNYLLGRALYLLGRYAESVPHLKEALAADGTDRVGLLRMLTEAYLHDGPPQPEKAQTYCTLLLEALGEAGEERFSSLVLQAELDYQVGDRAACERRLAELPADYEKEGRVALIRGQLAMDRAATLRQTGDAAGASQAFQDAIQAFSTAQGRDDLTPLVQGRAMFLLGTCQARLGNKKGAIGEFDRCPPGFYAELEAAELRQQAGLDDAALESYRQLLEFLAEGKPLANWMTEDELKRRLVAGFEGFFAAGRYGHAARLSELLAEHLPADVVLGIQARAQRAVGESHLAESRAARPAERAALERTARQHFRQAGRLHGLLAEQRLATPYYAADLWASAVDYLAAQSYPEAIRALAAFLQAETGGGRAPALVASAEARLALGQARRALQFCRECVGSYPHSPAAFQSRLLGARAHRELGELEEAALLLEENLNSDDLSPESREWRASLFALGQTRFEQGQFEAAIRRLEEAVRRYPEDPETIEARRRLAAAYRGSADELAARLPQEPLDSGRAALSTEIAGRRREALAQLAAAAKELNERRETRDLAPEEEALRRNVALAQGDTLFELGQYAEAARVYQDAIDRFHHLPEALPAFVQMSDCYRRLNQLDEARGALKQARVMLKRFSAETPFLETTNHSREEWAALLEQIEALLPAAAS